MTENNTRVMKTIITEVFGIFRSTKLPLPMRGDIVRVVNMATSKEMEAEVTAVNKLENTYNIRFIEPGVVEIDQDDELEEED